VFSFVTLFACLLFYCNKHLQLKMIDWNMSCKPKVVVQFLWMLVSLLLCRPFAVCVMINHSLSWFCVLKMLSAIFEQQNYTFFEARYFYPSYIFPYNNERKQCLYSSPLLALFVGHLGRNKSLKRQKQLIIIPRCPMIFPDFGVW